MFRRRILMAGIFILFCFSATAQSQSLAPNPKDVLTEMIEVYKRAESYRDSGSLLLISTSANERSLFAKKLKSQMSRKFKTYFTGPDSLRFEWCKANNESDRASVLWFTEGKGYSWAEDPALRGRRFALRQSSDLASLIRESSKPSGGVVRVIPSLLISNLVPYTFADVIDDLTDLSVIKQEVIDGESCFVIGGKVESTPWLFWIGTETHLLRKIRSFYTIGSFHDERKRRHYIAEEVHTQIELDGYIPEAIYHYWPTLRRGDLDLTR